jgi:hypothetical protein
MYPSTENLLKIRDGEPVDADAVAYVEADANARSELERLRRVQCNLQELPAFEAPDGVWARVIEAVDDGTSPQAGYWRWPLRAAIAAGVAVLAIAIVARQPDVSDPLATGPSTTVAETVPSNSIENIVGTPTYASLVSEAARLERAVRTMPYQSGVMSAGTASEIAFLEDQIAYVDNGLMYARQIGLTDAERTQLARYRVDLMNALYALRFSQARR